MPSESEARAPKSCRTTSDVKKALQSRGQSSRRSEPIYAQRGLTHFLKAEAQRLVCIRNWTPVNATAAAASLQRAVASRVEFPPPPFGGHA